MFTSFTSHEVSLLISVLRYANTCTDKFPREAREYLSQMAQRLQDELARVETKSQQERNVERPIMPGDGTLPVQEVKLAPLDPKDCEGLPVVEEVPADLYRQIDAITEIPPRFVGKHPTLGAPYGKALADWPQHEAPPAPYDPETQPTKAQGVFAASLDGMTSSSFPVYLRDTAPITVLVTESTTPPIWEFVVESMKTGTAHWKVRGGNATMEMARAQADDYAAEPETCSVRIVHHKTVSVDEADTQRCVIMKGNPVNGFLTVGPFNSREDAIAYGDSVDSEWWVIDLDSPDER